MLLRKDIRNSILCIYRVIGNSIDKFSDCRGHHKNHFLQMNLGSETCHYIATGDTGCGKESGPGNIKKNRFDKELFQTKVVGFRSYWSSTVFPDKSTIVAIVLLSMNEGRSGKWWWIHFYNWPMRMIFWAIFFIGWISHRSCLHRMDQAPILPSSAGSATDLVFIGWISHRSCHDWLDHLPIWESNLCLDLLPSWARHLIMKSLIASKRLT